MKKIEQIKTLSLLLITGILILSASFIIMSCGTDPQLKAQDPLGGAWALDTTTCPESGCVVTIPYVGLNESRRDITGKEVTIEALIKPKTNSTGIIFSFQEARGIALSVVSTAATTSTPAALKPKFSIKRVVTSATGMNGTSTVEYTVTGTVDLILDTWAHIAGILVNDDHTSVAGHGTCAGAESDTPHMDIYVDGNFAGCAATTGGTSADGDPDSDVFPGFAHNPAGLTAGTGGFQGIIDEARIWVDARSESELEECMDEELGKTGTCNRLTDDLMLYFRFNEGSGSTVNDYTGAGSGGGEYPDPDSAGSFIEWTNGWSTDQPEDLIAAD